MLCSLIFKAITGFFTLLSPCIFNNLLSNDLSPRYPHRRRPPPRPALSLSLCLSLFAPAANCPAASLRLQPPHPPTPPHLSSGSPGYIADARTHTHTHAAALASSWLAVLPCEDWVRVFVYHLLQSSSRLPFISECSAPVKATTPGERRGKETAARLHSLPLPSGLLWVLPVG